MNIFTLFDSNDINSIKLGIQVVKTLTCEKEFKKYFDVSFFNYEYLFNDLLNDDSILEINKIIQLKTYLGIPIRVTVRRW